MNSTAQWQPVSGMDRFRNSSGFSQEGPASLQSRVSQLMTLNSEQPAHRFRNSSGPPQPRARSYSQETWDQMWPKIQPRLDARVNQNQIVAEISTDEEAVRLNFHPTLAQLEGQIRKRRQSSRDPTRTGFAASGNPAVPNSEFQLVTDPRSSTSQISSSPGNRSMVDLPPVGFIFRPQSRQSVEEEYDIQPSGGEDPTPSLTSGTTPRALGDSQSDVPGGGCDVHMSGSCNMIDHSVGGAEGSDRPDTTSSVVMAGTWGPSLTLPDDTVFQAYPPVRLNPIDSDSTSTVSAGSKQSSSDALMFGAQWVHAPMQPPRLSEAARGFARLGYSPREWRTYLRDHSEIFNIPAVDFENAAQQALSFNRPGKARNYLDCMNLVWARSLLSEAAWEAFLESLIRAHEGQGNETHKKISKVFDKSRSQCLKHLKKYQPNFPDQAYCTVSVIPNVVLPVDQEMFNMEFLNSFNLETP